MKQPCSAITQMETDMTQQFCPFRLLQNFITVRGPYRSNTEPFFVFADGSPVTPQHMRRCLKKMLTLARVDKNNYDVHSFRVGRSCDLLKLYSQLRQ